jgi:hypothetical protein
MPNRMPLHRKAPPITSQAFCSRDREKDRYYTSCNSLNLGSLLSHPCTTIWRFCVDRFAVGLRLFQRSILVGRHNDPIGRSIFMHQLGFCHVTVIFSLSLIATENTRRNYVLRQIDVGFFYCFYQ